MSKTQDQQPTCLQCGTTKPADGKLFCGEPCKDAYAQATLSQITGKVTNNG